MPLNDIRRRLDLVLVDYNGQVFLVLIEIIAEFSCPLFLGGGSKKKIVGGHSYRAFMTVNLLAHAPHFFCCGIARSGAYNRTLTPFGFQVIDHIINSAAKSNYLSAGQISVPFFFRVLMAL
ncbi:hypothetical protein P3S68_024333 [Capsicum galapagoense]